MNEAMIEGLASLFASTIEEYAVIAVPLLLWFGITWACSALQALVKSASPEDSVLKRTVMRAAALGAMNVRHALMADDRIAQALKSEKAKTILSALPQPESEEDDSRPAS